MVTISQSGETLDTMEALKRAKELGHEHTLSICNVRESAIPRASRFVFYTRAGAEIGVASTKAFTTQLVALFTLALAIAKARGRLDADAEADAIAQLRFVPGSVQHALNLEPQVQAWAERFARATHALFLGRGIHYPVALEGALKLKEISYIHAEAYPAGELKHGPLALVDADDAGGGDRAQRRAAREGEVEHAGSARAAASSTCSPTSTATSPRARACT